MSAVPGRDFVRLALSIARTRGNLTDSLAYAEKAYGVASPTSMILRTSVASGTTTNSTWAEPLSQLSIASGDFIHTLRPRTLLGRMQGLRRVPPRCKIPRSTSGVSAAFVGQTSPISVSAMALDSIEFLVYQLCALVVCSDELLRLSDGLAENVLRNDMIAACVQAADEAFISNTAIEAGVSPAGICSGADTVASSGSTHAAIASDLRKLFDLVGDAGIKLTNPYLCCTPRTAAALSLMRGSTGSPVWPGVTVQGGELAGVPLLVSAAVAEAVSSEDSPADSPAVYTSAIVLLDASEILVCDPSVATIDLSRNASVQLDDAPDSPTTASTTTVSLWQQNLASLRVVRPVNWAPARDGAVAVLTGCQY